MCLRWIICNLYTFLLASQLYVYYGKLQAIHTNVNGLCLFTSEKEWI